ncbi:MAG: homoserine O-acetyltransferase [Melioribacteraceae bacterium]|nr:homoserine O-acetyltransferase [Melioribacteraceae bacterium]
MMAKTEIVKINYDLRSFKLENGEELRNVNIAYQSYGELNSDGTNVILICHALSGNAHAAGVLEKEESDPYSKFDLLKSYSKMFSNSPGWWDPLIGPGKVFDTEKYFVVCTNILGSCYGTTGPTSFKNDSQDSYASDFPHVTVRDMVELQKVLIDKLGIKKIVTAAGGSLGGMQVLEWAIMYPEIIQSIIPIATAVKHSPWAISFNHTGREAIKADPIWNKGRYSSQPENGLAVARRLAMISYRSFPSFGERFGRNISKFYDEFLKRSKYDIESYLDYQGQKLVNRFDANSYISITNTLDTHDITRGRGELEGVLGSIKIPTLGIGISTDILYPPSEQKEFLNMIPDSIYKEIESIHGHDAFLIEFDQLTAMIYDFIN